MLGSFCIVPGCLFSLLMSNYILTLFFWFLVIFLGQGGVSSFFLPLSPPSLPSFLLLLPFIKLPKQGRGKWTSIYWGSLFARNLTCIVSLNPWNNAERLDWLFLYFCYFKEEETEPKWCRIPWPRSHGWCWQIYIWLSPKHFDLPFGEHCLPLRVSCLLGFPLLLRVDPVPLFMSRILVSHPGLFCLHSS